MASPVGATLMLPDEVTSLASGAAVVGAFTDIDISAYTGSQVAKAALLRVEMFVFDGVMQLRENGTNPTNPRTYRHYGNITGPKAIKTSSLFIIPVDENETFEYKVPTMSLGDNGTGWEIFLEGWYV